MKLTLLLASFALTGCTAAGVTTTPIEVLGEVEQGAYIAGGVAPFWQLLIEDKKITLTFDREGRGGPGSIRNYFYPAASAENVNGVRSWRSGTGSDRISIEMNPGPCERQDGFRFSDRVKISVAGRELKGCGGESLEKVPG